MSADNPTGMKVVAYINAVAVDIAAKHGDAYHIGKTPAAVMLPLVTLADAESFVRDALRYRFIREDHSLGWEEEIDAALSKLGEKGNG